MCVYLYIIVKNCEFMSYNSKLKSLNSVYILQFWLFPQNCEFILQFCFYLVILSLHLTIVFISQLSFILKIMNFYLTILFISQFWLFLLKIQSFFKK